MAQDAKKSETPEEKKFGKFEFKGGVYQIYNGRTVIDSGGHRVVDPEDPSFAIHVPKHMSIDLDAITDFPTEEIRQDRLQKAREYLIKMGAVEVTDELVKIREAKIKKQEILAKELADLEKDETLLRNKQMTERRKKMSNVQGIGSL